MKRNVTVFIGVIIGLFLMLVIYLMLHSKFATVTSEPVPRETKKIEQVEKVVSASPMSNEDVNIESPDPNHEDLPTPQPFPLHEESKPATHLKQHADAKPPQGNELPFAIDWLSASEAVRMPTKDILSKSRVKSKESFEPRLITTRQEAVIHLNVNISFADTPSRAFESSDYFFFSAPLTQDFSAGFILNKKTGEISIW